METGAALGAASAAIGFEGFEQMFALTSALAVMMRCLDHCTQIFRRRPSRQTPEAEVHRVLVVGCLCCCLWRPFHMQGRWGRFPVKQAKRCARGASVPPQDRKDRGVRGGGGDRNRKRERRGEERRGGRPRDTGEVHRETHREAHRS